MTCRGSRTGLDMMRRACDAGALLHMACTRLALALRGVALGLIFRENDAL